VSAWNTARGERAERRIDGIGTPGIGPGKRAISRWLRELRGR